MTPFWRLLIDIRVGLRGPLRPRLARIFRGPRIGVMRHLSRLGCGNHGHLTHRPCSGLLNHIIGLDHAACPACSDFSTLLSMAHLLMWSLNGLCKNCCDKFRQIDHLEVPCISAINSTRHVLAVGAASFVFTTQIVSHVSVL